MAEGDSGLSDNGPQTRGKKGASPGMMRDKDFILALKFQIESGIRSLPEDHNGGHPVGKVSISHANNGDILICRNGDRYYRISVKQTG